MGCGLLVEDPVWPYVLVPCFLRHNCLQILYTSNFVIDFFFLIIWKERWVDYTCKRKCSSMNFVILYVFDVYHKFIFTSNSLHARIPRL